jgi:hypothetical protein
MCVDRAISLSGRGAGEEWIPRSIRSAIGERVSRLGEVSGEILREASVLGQAFAFDDLQAMGDRGEEHVEATLEAAKAGGLVSVTGKDDYAFSHALVLRRLRLTSARTSMTEFADTP